MQLDVDRPSWLGSLPTGWVGTKATLAMMVDLVRRYRRSQHIRTHALQLIEHLAPKDVQGEVRAIFEWVRDHVRYVRDVRGVETLHTPTATLEIGQGDCDDVSVLLAALLESVGHPTRFVVVGHHPDHMRHVYVEARVGNRWVALDPTIMHHVGWRPPVLPVTRYFEV